MRFEAVVRVTHIETWTVDAKNEAEARKKINELDSLVETDETGGEVSDWEIYRIKQVQE